jgi:hypothetical protein
MVDDTKAKWDAMKTDGASNGNGNGDKVGSSPLSQEPEQINGNAEATA